MSADPVSPSDFEKRYTGERPRSRMYRIARERAARVSRITALLNEGHSVGEIALIEGVNDSAITRLLRLTGVQVARTGPGNFTLMVSARRVTLPALDRLCQRWKCSRSEAAGRIMSACLRRNGELAELAIKDSRKRTKKRRGAL